MRYLLSMAACAVALAFASPAFATGNDNGPSNNCNGNGSCSQDTINNTTNKEGTGVGVGIGQGGAGGDATATSQNTNTNVNANSASSDQSQRQGQAQGQSQSTSNANNSSQSVNVEGDSYDAPRMVHLAPALSVAPSANCALAQGASVGVLDLFSVGGTVTYIDEGCALREAIRLGMADSDPRVRAAASSRLLDLLGASDNSEQTSDVHTSAPDEGGKDRPQQVSGDTPDYCTDPAARAKFNGDAFCPQG